MTPGRPIIVLGAPRSGTNLLRDTLTRLPGLGTWPCDEINPIWRHGNARWPDDELTPEQARPEVSAYIQRAFRRSARRGRHSTTVEKTCANSLRVPFVHRVFPAARYIFLLRDGRDAVASAMERWRAPFDLSYTLRKLRFVPLTDLPRYALEFLHNTGGGRRTRRTWGPRFRGMDRFLDTHGLAATCATQWRLCVEGTAKALEGMDDRAAVVRYEDLVTDPARELARLAVFVGAGTAESASAFPERSFSRDSVGRWRSRLTPGEQDTVESLLRPTLESLGYAPGPMASAPPA